MITKSAVRWNEYAEFELLEPGELLAVAGGDIYIHIAGGGYIPFMMDTRCLHFDSVDVRQPLPVIGLNVDVPQRTATGSAGAGGAGAWASTASGGYAYVGANGVGGLYLNAACIDNLKCGSNVPC